MVYEGTARNRSVFEGARWALSLSCASVFALCVSGLISQGLAAEETAINESLTTQEADAHLYHQLQRARVLIAQGEPEAAREILERVAAEQPANQSLALELERLRGMTLLSPLAIDNDEREAERYLAEASMRVRLNRIQQLMAQEDFAAAEISITSAQAQLQNYPWPEAKEALGRLNALLVEAQQRRDVRMRFHCGNCGSVLRMRLSLPVMSLRPTN